MKDLHLLASGGIDHPESLRFSHFGSERNNQNESNRNRQPPMGLSAMGVGTLAKGQSDGLQALNFCIMGS